jgi:hypothetical protein
MKTKWINKSLYLLLCLGMATAAIGQRNAPSVLDRVQNESDPELGELIRTALENNAKLRSSDRTKPLELIRKVTISYTQIKLFDQQIAEITRKIEAKAGPAELRNELMLAKTELEAKRMTELANLREVMGIIPRHAFEKRSIETLNTWLVLNLIGDRVYVLDSLKSFQEFWASRRHISAGLITESETLDYIRECFKSKNKLPIRIDIYYKPEKKSAAEDLQKKIVSLAIKTDSQMETEVHTELSGEYVGSGKAPFFLKNGKIRTLYPAAMKRPDGGPKPLITGLVNPNDLEQHILWRLTMPKNVPLTFRIEYDEASALLAKQVAEMCRSTSKRLGIAEVIGVEEVPVQPVPESVFLGRWLAITDGEIREIEFQTQGQSQLTMKSGGKKVIPAPWTPSTKEIFIDTSRWVTYKGYLNAEGNLFLDKGQIFPQGSWHNAGLKEIVFKKVK